MVLNGLLYLSNNNCLVKIAAMPFQHNVPLAVTDYLEPLLKGHVRDLKTAQDSCHCRKREDESHDSLDLSHL